MITSHRQPYRRARLPNSADERRTNPAPACPVAGRGARTTLKTSARLWVTGILITRTSIFTRRVNMVQRTALTSVVRRHPRAPGLAPIGVTSATAIPARVCTRDAGGPGIRLTIRTEGKAIALIGFRASERSTAVAFGRVLGPKARPIAASQLSTRESGDRDSRRTYKQGNHEPPSKGRQRNVVSAHVQLSFSRGKELRDRPYKREPPRFQGKE